MNDVTNTTATSGGDETDDGGNSDHVGIIVGVIVGALVVVAITLLLVLFILRRRRRRKQNSGGGTGGGLGSRTPAEGHSLLLDNTAGSEASRKQPIHGGVALDEVDGSPKQAEDVNDKHPLTPSKVPEKDLPHPIFTSTPAKPPGATPDGDVIRSRASRPKTPPSVPVQDAKPPLSSDSPGPLRKQRNVSGESQREALTESQVFGDFEMEVTPEKKGVAEVTLF